MRPMTEGPTPTDREYEISRMAEVVAEATSGVRDAVPEQDDYDRARALLDALEEMLEDELLRALDIGDRAAEIEYRVMLARNLERNFGFGF